MIKVSVIIIAYNRANYLPEAIESVFTQNFIEWELILVDDGSTDGSPSVMRNYAEKDSRVRCIFNEKNLGICKTRERGLEAAQGEFIAILDSDDIWCDTDKLKKQYNFLKNNDKYILVGGGVVIMDEKKHEIKRYLNTCSSAAVHCQMLIKNPFTHSTVMYRRAIALEVGGYSCELDGMEINAIEDYDLWLRLGIKGELINLPEYFVQYRIHSGNISVQKRLKLMETTCLLIKHYRARYPLFWFAWTRRIARLYIYKIYKFFIK